jgi:hypothetical protein
VNFVTVLTGSLSAVVLTEVPGFSTRGVDYRPPGAMSLKIFLPLGTSAWDTIYQTPDGQPVYRAVRAARYGDGKDTLKVFKIDVKAKVCLPPCSYPDSGSRRSSLFELWAGI